MQILFSINPFLPDTVHEAWFGSVTTGLSVFISATMLSKILDIWHDINKAQTERDNKTNEVKQFMHTHGITGELKDQVSVLVYRADHLELFISSPPVSF